MIKRISVFVITLFSFAITHAQQKPTATIRLRSGMKITTSQKITKTLYKIDDITKDSGAVIIIEGNNITIDFNNAELNGSNAMKNADGFFGTAILIRNSRKVTIKNLRASGYKIALRAENVEQLILDNCNFSYNYRQHLQSTTEKEDEADWMSFHQNEKDEWLRYGAGMYLRNCDSAVIKDCTVTGGQNALMMTACSGGMIYNNDFSFNSGVGIGMYRCNRNNVMYNRLIFNVRGYSHGVYSGGQDSAGILVYEQSSNNLFYKNNVTHGGDGLFLWAGQSTMDSGNGGCNDNIISGNDFSYAATNGVEATFSRNIISDNRMYECENGIWGGYSYSSIIRNNKFRNNTTAIAIEHGQDNRIAFNIFYKDREAIRLWARDEQPVDWGYAKTRDIKSRGYIIVSNSFNGNPLAFHFKNTDRLVLFSNSFSGVDEIGELDSTVSAIDTLFDDALSQELAIEPTMTIPGIDAPNNPFKGTGPLAGRKNILVTEWGPYDFRSPIAWQTNPGDTTDLLSFTILGPKGKWRIKNTRGLADLSLQSGELPATFTARRLKDTQTGIYMELEYVGVAITSPSGGKVLAGKPYTFVFKEVKGL